MFGFLRPTRCDTTYHQLYAGCCASQHRQFGIESLPLLSYEAVFLYVLAVDSGCCDAPEPSAVRCCRLRTRGERLYQVEPSIAAFCSSFGLLLASIKLEDDVRDSGSLLARFALWRLGSRVQRAEDYFVALDPQFRECVRSFITQHMLLELQGRRHSLEEYSEPTAAAFGYLFELYARVLPDGVIPAESLREMGREVGKAIICFDCAADWHRDRRTGQYNPLPNEAACEQAILASKRSLSRVIWQCAQAFGADSHAAKVARETFSRVGTYELSRRVIRGTGVPHRKHARQGDCDVPCDAACCDCGGGCGGGDVSAEWGGSHFCCIDCCTGPGSDCGRLKPKAPKKEVDDRPFPPDYVGSTGTALGPLNPSGVVLIDGVEVPARSNHGWIDANTEVNVVRQEAFGVVVRLQTPEL